MFVDERIAATSRAIPAGAGRTALAAAGLSLLLHASALAGFLLVGQGTPPAPLPIVAVELVGEPGAQPGVTDGEPAAAAEAAAPEEGAPDPTAPAPREVAEQTGPAPSDAIGELEDAESEAIPAPASEPMPAEPRQRTAETAPRADPETERPTLPPPEQTRARHHEDREQPEAEVEPELAETALEPDILPEPPPRKPAVPAFAKFPPPPERPPRAVEMAAPVKAPKPLPTAAPQPVETAAPAAPEQARPNLARGRDVSDERASNLAATGQTGEQLAAAMHGQAAPAPLGEGAGNPQPRYPYSARRLGQEGEVVLRVRVSRDGAPESVAVYRSSGHASLDAEALRTVRRWRFEPARRRGAAVPGTVEVPILFQLTER